jgi:hypothetical protein
MNSASVAEYDEAERTARRLVSNAQIMCCEPVTFNRLGYPTRVTAEHELTHYVDLLSLNGLANVPFDAGVFFRGASLYASYSPDEADLLVKVCDRVAALTRNRFGKAVRPIINPPTQIGMFRAVQATANLLGKRQLRIFEIGNPLESSPDFIIAEFKSKGFEQILSSKFYAFSPAPERIKKKLAMFGERSAAVPPIQQDGRVKGVRVHASELGRGSGYPRLQLLRDRMDAAYD